jgi:hypothetical protein
VTKPSNRHYTSPRSVVHNSMNRAYYILTTILILISFFQVSGQKNKSFCENEYLLLSGFNKTMETDFSFFEIRTDTKAKLETLVDNVYCHYFELLLNFEFDSVTIIPINTHINYMVECEVLPPPFNPRHYIHLFLSGSDTLFIERDVGEIDQLEEIVLAYFQSKSEEVFKRTCISLFWENTISETFFQRTIIQCLNAYSRFIAEQSHLLYGQSTCELNQEKLRDLYNKYPFNIGTDFHYKNFHYMNVPIPPPEYIEENDDINQGE